MQKQVNSNIKPHPKVKGKQVFAFFLAALILAGGIIPIRAEASGRQNPRLVVKITPETRIETIARETGGRLVRKSALDYATLEYDGASLSPEQIREKVLQAGGVLHAEWSNACTIDSPGTIDSLGTKLSGSETDPDGELTEPRYPLQWAIQNIRADKVWDEGATGQGIVVAVIDTGVDLDHPDLKGQLVPGYNAITGSTAAGAARDDNGHGTSVAGAIAAGKNGIGILGVAYGARIMPVKAMDSKGSGENDVIADGIVWAVDHGAKIINLSMGAERQTAVFDEALDYALDKGCLVVAASGNTDAVTHLSGVAYPGAYPGILAVSAIDSSNLITDFSRVGPEIELAAPGKRILTDYWSQDTSGEAYATGTSIAAPIVSGAAALIWSRYPALAAQEVRQLLLNSAADLGTTGRDDDYGYGKVDCYRALKLAQGLKQLSSPAAVSWEGGKIGSSAGEAVLTVPAGAFKAGLDERNNDASLQVSVGEAALPGSLPQGILPGGKAYQISWEGQETHKPLNLSLSMTRPVGETGQPENEGAQEPAERTGKLACLYLWSSARWLRIGGGIPFAEGQSLEVPVNEPGIYMIGYTDEPSEPRISGSDRVQTAVEIAEEAYPTGCDTVIVARADDYPDALAGAPLAYQYHAPILLTDPDTLPREVEEAVKRLAPGKIIVLGGTGAVSGSVENSLQRLAATERIAGSDRFGTAAAIAEKLGNTGQAVIVSGSNYPDAVAAAAHAAISGRPILLTGSFSLNSTTRQTLRKLSVTETEVIGGEGAVSSRVERDLPAPRRIGGADRYETSARLLQAYPPQGRVLYAATGADFPDALTGGVLAAAGMSNILLLPPGELSPSQITVLSALSQKKCVALGGAGVISENILQEIGTLLK
ncbi:Subtilisin [Syntrophobotulus glycolicus DSM 8271]|uniref:Subtilisin n=1 Tax=Syntrophobotulus glycolicus (strain DSM 8271 / FlGlyR) TaxID=645991 RepID=F0SZU5_SYNGF|nr:S8 family serine peptidase [Syntrophobotulus glycolicus]ADY57266.1 Subtilisin [Syntrophobotulus glycolicus DSM 8271]